jgi:4-amino-4-deoxy-L-arabinose transferase-like glycosyltransferase
MSAAQPLDHTPPAPAGAAGWIRAIGVHWSRWPAWLGPDVLVAGITVAVSLALGVALMPRIDFPIHDEAFYAGPALRLAQTGELLLPAEVQPSLVALVVWGAGFLKLFGGGFVTLRLAALAASVLCAVVFYALLRQAGLDRARSALGLGVLALNPLYVSSSLTFMTETLFTALVLASLLLGLIALRQERTAPLLGAGLLVALAFLTRQIGILPAMALVLGLSAHHALRRRPQAWLALVGPPLLAVVAFAAWRYGPGGSPVAGYVLAASANQWSDGGFALTVLRRLAFCLAYLGAFTLPLLVIVAPAVPRRIARLDRCGKVTLTATVAVALACGLILWAMGQRQIPYLGNLDDVVRGLGVVRLPGLGTAAQDAWLMPIALAVWGAGGVSLGLMLGAVPRSARVCWRHPQMPIYLTAALLTLATVSSYLVLERYYFPLLPFALIAVLVAMRARRLWLPVVVLVLGLSAALSFAFMIDKGQRAALHWEIGRDLVRSGIAESAIDAGFDWVAWWYYWRQYPLGEGVPGELGPFRRQLERPYRLAPSPMPGYRVVDTRSYWSPLGWKTRQVHVLRREGAGASHP